MRFKMMVGGAAVVLVVGAFGAYLLLRPISSVVATSHHDIPKASSGQLQEVGALRVYLAHQSVGRDMLEALPTVFADAGVATPSIVETTDAVDVAGPGIVHSFVGENGDPIGKIAAFDAAIRGGLGDSIDVAMIKLCYTDFHRGDDARAVFEAYRDTMTKLELDYPDVTFVYATASLTAEGTAFERAKDRVKRLLGRPGYWPDPSRNVVRHAFNELVRDHYGDSGRLFDLAAVQATDPNGRLEVRSWGGSEYSAMARPRATDYGHLTDADSAVLAGAFLATIAEAVT